MDQFVSRKKPRLLDGSGQLFPESHRPSQNYHAAALDVYTADEEESTDVKLAILSSLHPDRSQENLLDILLSCDGSVTKVLERLSAITQDASSPRKRKHTVIGAQRSLSFGLHDGNRTVHGIDKRPSQLLTKKGKTLHLYSPSDIAKHTPCSIIHNFLPSYLADALLEELLPEVTSYSSATFKLFDNIVSSPHTACFYVDSLTESNRIKNEYYYNGSNLDDIREILPVMRQVSGIVREAVNQEIAIRIRDFYPEGQKLKYQSPKEWEPNAAFVNCYDGGAQSVGYHADQLSYLGPRAVIGSLSLGVAREFRVRKIVPKDDNDEELNDELNTSNTTSHHDKILKPKAADISGQISIHLPHNSLLVMHAEMQEEWKHSIAPVNSIDPHPVAGNKRINITYRWYREEFNPKYTPKCRCGVPTVLKTVQRQKANRGKYMWMCQTGGRVEATGKGCGFFEWAEFDDDGVPIWKKGGAGVKRVES